MLLLNTLETRETAGKEIAEGEKEALKTMIAGENATPISELPEVWQAIANGTSNVRLRDSQAYVAMAQLFHYKLSHGDIDLFNERPELAHLKDCFCELLGQLATETLEFYGQDFQVKGYPDFDIIFRELERREVEAERLNVARIGIDLFSEFGYDLPASFYRVNLAPLYRDHVFEERALRFDPRDQGHKRPWDAALHAGKVYAVQMKIQSVASQYGLTYQHGCGCDSHISAVDEAAGAFDYNLDTPKRDRWIRSFVWTAWYEYAFFGLIPNTAYLTKSAS